MSFAELFFMASERSDYAGAAGGAASLGLMIWLYNRIKSDPAQLEGGTSVLRYNSIIHVFGWVFLVMSIGGVIGFLWAAPESSRMAGAILFGAFGIGCGFMIRACQRCTVLYTNGEITYTPLFGSPFTTGWDQITKVDFSAGNQWWVIRLRGGRNMRVSMLMDGHRHFLALAGQRAGIRIPKLDGA